tara:strand:+ start:609 stop:1058 length:450 start_codon:yes stop_codon:yes gene_type:complete
MGPFPTPHFKVQVNALNRSRPGLSTHFNLPFKALCNGMQVMHRTGYVITEMQPISSPQKLKSSASNAGGTALEAGKTLVSKLSGKDKDSSNKQKPSQAQSPSKEKETASKDEKSALKAGKGLINKLTRKGKDNTDKQKSSQRNKRQRKK